MRRSGFTILELLLVIALLVILTALTWPSIDAMYGEVRLSAGADQVRSAMTEARTRAIEDFRPYRVAIKPGTGEYRVAVYGDGSGDLAGTDSYDADATDAVKSLTLEDELPKGVLFAEEVGGTPSSDDAEDGYSTFVIFRPDGSADRDNQITFQASGCRRLQVRLRGITGVVTSQWLPPEN